jgi:hypothetical protein
MTLHLERRDQAEGGRLGGGIMMTPAVGENYWAYRVWLSGRQAMLGFPKFNTIGIGFAVEEDWNTNLPYTCTADDIYPHRAQRGDDRITREECIAAIELIQDAAASDRGEAETAAERARIYHNGPVSS